METTSWDLCQKRLREITERYRLAKEAAFAVYQQDRADALEQHAQREHGPGYLSAPERHAQRIKHQSEVAERREKREAKKLRQAAEYARVQERQRQGGPIMRG